MLKQSALLGTGIQQAENQGGVRRRTPGRTGFSLRGSLPVETR
jgi:hypothetical protein